MSEVTQVGAVKLTPIELLLILRRRNEWSREEAAAKLRAFAQRKVGDDLQISERALRSWEEGTREPRPIVLKIIRQFVEAA